ncbi:vomeronasal type-1 receptor 45-like [Apodemus sylvaticus]|uniref:vomeronasal type-1 receptor 45-like n=1 Tax=Apodemus sylvaticus TaxID=10129 RepID=UPI002243A892|nr:vomeronasal type-1 receptor 45-like [Apodemus sylvaticus]
MMNKNSRLHTNSNIRITFYLEIGIGISGNSFLLLFHTLKFINGHRPRLTDLPIGFLSLIHLLTLLVVVFITTDSFILRTGWDDIICKFLLYLYRVLRGLSLCNTSVLSVLQAIILSPRSSCLAKLKHRSPYHISCSIMFLGVLHMLISSHLLVSIVATTNLTRNDCIYVTESCCILHLSYFMQSMFSTLIAIREVFLISLMALSTCYMVALLCRHKKQAQNLQGTCHSLKTSPEQRATQTILMLMSFFVLMCIFDSIVSSPTTMFLNDPTSYSIQIFVVHIYATVSPFVFMSSEKQIVNFLRSMCERNINV